MVTVPEHDAKRKLHVDRAVAHVWKQWIRKADEVWRDAGEDPDKARWEHLFQDRTDATSGDAIPNSLQAAESLLCILLPHWALRDFDLSDPRQPSSTVAERLMAFGGSTSVLKAVQDKLQLSTDTQLRFLSIFRWYFDTYSMKDDDRVVQDFTVGSYLTVDPAALDPEGASSRMGEVEVTDSYTFSVTLCLIAKHLAREWSDSPDPQLARRCLETAAMASDRLTSALLGLCDSFCVARFTIEAWTSATSTEWPGERVESMRTRLNVLLNQSGLETIQTADAFECGWTWGRVRQPLHLNGGDQLRGTRLREVPFAAQAAPYFYFTLCAVDGITDLFSPRVETSELLNAEQMLLASRLKQLWDISSQYWAEIARSPRIIYGTAARRRWSVQIPPWVASDGDASDYGSVALAGILIRAMSDRRLDASDADVLRLTELLEELTQRAQINREPAVKKAPLDAAVEELVVRGRSNRLFGTTDGEDDDPLFVWSVLDFVPQLFKRVCQLMALAPTSDLRRRLEYLAEEIWQMHLADRLVSPTADTLMLWDDPRNLGVVRMAGINSVSGKSGLSWYMTERVIEALIAFQSAQLPSPGDPSKLIELVEVIRERAKFELANERHLYHDQLQRLEEAQGSAVDDPLRSLAAALQALGEIWKSGTWDSVSRRLK